MHCIIQHPHSHTRISSVHHFHGKQRHIEAIEIVVTEHIAVTPFSERMPFDPAVIFCHQQRISITPILITGLTQNNLFPLGNMTFIAGKNFRILSGTHFILTRISMDIVQSDNGVSIQCRLFHPPLGIIGRSLILVIGYYIRPCKHHLFRQPGILFHFSVKTEKHLFPHFIITIGRCPVSIRLVEDYKILDTGETKVIHQIIKIVDGHIHPFLILLHIPGRRIVFTVHDGYPPLGTIPQESGNGSYIPRFIIRSCFGIIIAIGAVYHATYILRLHKVESFAECFPVFIRDRSTPSFSLIIGIPLGTIADISGIRHFR